MCMTTCLEQPLQQRDTLAVTCSFVIGCFFMDFVRNRFEIQSPEEKLTRVRLTGNCSIASYVAIAFFIELFRFVS